MPLHDWTHIPAGLFHHFHQDWSIEIARELNRGRLPQGLSALVEQRSGPHEADVLTIESTRERDVRTRTAAAERPLRNCRARGSSVGVRNSSYASRANRIVVRHHLGRIVAVIEIISPGNKDSRAALRDFIEKTIDLLRAGIHVLIVDLFPPTPRPRRHPQGGLGRGRGGGLHLSAGQRPNPRLLRNRHPAGRLHRAGRGGRRVARHAAVSDEFLHVKCRWSRLIGRLGGESGRTADGGRTRRDAGTRRRRVKIRRMDRLSSRPTAHAPRGSASRWLGRRRGTARLAGPTSASGPGGGRCSPRGRWWWRGGRFPGGRSVRPRDLMQSSQLRTWSPVWAQPGADMFLARRIDVGLGRHRVGLVVHLHPALGPDEADVAGLERTAGTEHDLHAVGISAAAVGGHGRFAEGVRASTWPCPRRRPGPCRRAAGPTGRCRCSGSPCRSAAPPRCPRSSSSRSRGPGLYGCQGTGPSHMS